MPSEYVRTVARDIRALLDEYDASHEELWTAVALALGCDEIRGFDEKSDTERWLICFMGTLVPDKHFGDSPTEGWSLIVNYWGVEFNEFVRELALRMEQHIDHCVDEKVQEIRDYYECGDGW